MAVPGQDRLGCGNASRSIWQRYLHPSKARSLLSTVLQQGSFLRISATEYFKNWTEITQDLQMKKRHAFGGTSLDGVSGVGIDSREIKLLANNISHMLRVLRRPQEKRSKRFYGRYKKGGLWGSVIQLWILQSLYDALVILKTFRYLNSSLDYFFAIKFTHSAVESMMSNV